MQVWSIKIYCRFHGIQKSVWNNEKDYYWRKVFSNENNLLEIINYQVNKWYDDDKHTENIKYELKQTKLKIEFKGKHFIKIIHKVLDGDRMGIHPEKIDWKENNESSIPCWELILIEWIISINKLTTLFLIFHKSPI